MEKKVDGNYTRMLQAILNKSWRQHPICTVTHHKIKVRPTRHAGHCYRSRDELISDILLGPLHMDGQRQDDKLEPTYSSSAPIWDVILKTSRKQWTYGGVAREGQGYPYGWHDVMMMMMVYTCVNAKSRTSLLSFSLLLQQWLPCLVPFTWMVCKMGGK